ncbi:MAG: response regulator [Planctomycetes bacterium]|nr:response regulator [Planctomycetota bacterium]
MASDLRRLTESERRFVTGSRRPGNIIVVDEEVHIRSLLGFVLKEQNHAVAVTDDPDMAFEHILEEGKVDLILLSIHLPDSGTAEMLQRLLEIPAKMRPGVIAVKHYSSEEAAPESSGIEILDTITKPIKIKQLTAKLESHISRLRG